MNKNYRKDKRKKKVRAKIFGTADVPRFSVSVSLAHIRAQIINDNEGKTICESDDLKSKAKATKTEKAKSVGVDIAEKALKKGIKKVVFDRGAKLYHGRVKALADAAREKGLVF